MFSNAGKMPDASRETFSGVWPVWLYTREATGHINQPHNQPHAGCTGDTYLPRAKERPWWPSSVAAAVAGRCIKTGPFPPFCAFLATLWSHGRERKSYCFERV